jgi:hypothetical protein
MIVKGIGLSRLRSVLLLLADAARVAFTGTSSFGRVFLAQQSHISILQKRLSKVKSQKDT